VYAVFCIQNNEEEYEEEKEKEEKKNKIEMTKCKRNNK